MFTRMSFGDGKAITKHIVLVDGVRETVYRSGEYQIDIVP